MNKDELAQFMPHRDPMFLVDRSRTTNEGVESEYTVPDHPYYTQGHFPGNPIVPGVILCEIMAQGSVLLFKDRLYDSMALYAGMDKVRFKRQVHPGDKITVRSTLGRCRGQFLQVNSTAYVADEVCAQGQLSFMLTQKQVPD